MPYYFLIAGRVMAIPWDKGEALDRIARACIDGDFDAARLGWLRLTEAGTNASYAKVIPVLLELRTMRDAQAHEAQAQMEATASMEHNLGLVISQAEIEQADTARLSTRLALAELAIEELILSVRALLARKVV